VDTIQLQCGSCGQMMAISPAHLGAQVQCPHCQAVVQTPAPTDGLAAGAFDPQLPTVDLAERDSIFGQPEPTDDLFGAGPLPQIEMPRMEMAPPPPPPPPPMYEPTVTMEAAREPYAPAPFTSPAPYGAPETYAPAPAPAEDDAGEPIAPVLMRRPSERSLLVPIVLIFLIPYSVFTTAFIGYLLYVSRQQVHPLKMLPDNAPKGAPRHQVKHDLPLDPDMKVALGKAIRVGDIEVTPLRVKHTTFGDLVLVFRAKNLSDKLIFNPISDDYVRHVERGMDAGRPYTFLERSHPGQQFRRLYGGNLEWFREGEKLEPFDGDLRPGEEAVIHLISESKSRGALVNSFVNADERLLWRVQVRRGPIPVDGQLISATTVVGVDFSAREIMKDAGGG